MFEVFEFTKLDFKFVLIFDEFNCTLGNVELKIHGCDREDLLPCLIYSIDLCWPKDGIESWHDGLGEYQRVVNVLCQ